MQGKLVGALIVAMSFAAVMSSCATSPTPTSGPTYDDDDDDFDDDDDVDGIAIDDDDSLDGEDPQPRSSPNDCSNGCEPGTIVVDGTPFVELPACCAGDACGLDLTPSAQLLGMEGCMETADSAATLDASCPSTTLDVMENSLELPGCCQNNVCGVVFDVTAMGGHLGLTGPNFGCQSGLDGAEPKPCG
jgi:hypothetical protein